MKPYSLACLPLHKRLQLFVLMPYAWHRVGTLTKVWIVCDR